jgi:hypothetical protein
LFPNLPCCNDEGFHKEVVIEITSSHLHHLEERCSKQPLKTNQLPATNCEWTSEEQMNSSFFSVQVT